MEGNNGILGENLNELSEKLESALDELKEKNTDFAKFSSLYEMAGEGGTPTTSNASFYDNGKNYFAIGFKNKSGGYEVRNRFFKGCMSPMDITHIRQPDPLREHTRR